MDNQKSYYAIIPANVRYNEKLTPNAKLLYWEITALCNEKWFCRANNQYFSDLYKKSKVSISKRISQLESYWYIETEIIYKSDSQEILNRYITIIKNPTKEKLSRPTKEKFKDNNNTDINNTINNIIINNNTENPKKSGNSDINNLIQTIKDKVKEYWLAYDNTQERKFARHILVWKDFWNFAESIWKSRDELCISVINASIQINYFRGPCTGPKSIYKLYSDVYNQRMSKRWWWNQSNVLVI